MGINEELERQVVELVETSVVEMSNHSRYVELILLNLGCYFRENPDHLSTKLPELLQTFVPNPYFYPNLFPGLTAAQSQSFIKRVITSFIDRARNSRTTNAVPEAKECEHPSCKLPAEECDHILPYSWGGPNVEWNYQYLCKPHNRVKGSTLSLFAHKLHADENFQTAFVQWYKAT